VLRAEARAAVANTIRSNCEQRMPFADLKSADAQTVTGLGIRTHRMYMWLSAARSFTKGRGKRTEHFTKKTAEQNKRKTIEVREGRHLFLRGELQDLVLELLASLLRVTEQHCTYKRMESAPNKQKTGSENS
jgi:hypothetical protein